MCQHIMPCQHFLVLEFMHMLSVVVRSFMCFLYPYCMCVWYWPWSYLCDRRVDTGNSSALKKRVCFRAAKLKLLLKHREMRYLFSSWFASLILICLQWHFLVAWCRDLTLSVPTCLKNHTVPCYNHLAPLFSLYDHA